MALTKDFRETVRKRARKEPQFREALIRDAVNLARSGDTKTGHAMLRNYTTAVIERDGDGFVALCPEFDIASQGSSTEEARANLVEALELFFETAPLSEIERRMHG